MVKIILVTGGARSGKSTFAEKLALISGKKVGYIATAEVGDQEMAERIELHRMRRPAEWITYEAPLQAETVVAEAGDRVSFFLFDCLTVYTANQLLAQPDSSEFRTRCAAVLAAVDRLLDAARNFAGTIVFVTNEVGDGIVPDNRLAREFRDVAGLVNQKVAAAADEVYWMVCGLPVEIKKQATPIRAEAN